MSPKYSKNSPRMVNTASCPPPPTLFLSFKPHKHQHPQKRK
uniref:Uncharacterized protein n=1 Tax=Populus trichocarpa TaxID=3694 RepID=A0A3N7G0C4_POPTR